MDKGVVAALSGSWLWCFPAHSSRRPFWPFSAAANLQVEQERSSWGHQLPALTIVGVSIFHPDKHRLSSPSPQLGVQTLDAAGPQRRSICSFSLSLMLDSVLTSSHSFFTRWQRSLTSSTQSHKYAGKLN